MTTWWVAECISNTRHVQRGERAFLQFAQHDLVDAAIEHHRETGHGVSVTRFVDDGAEEPVLWMPAVEEVA